jgi:cytochrome c oxidase subunit 2
MRRRGALICAFVAGLPALVAAADGQGPTPNMFAPVSTPAHAIREIAFFVLGITGAIFVVVAGLTLYTIIRFRRRAGDGPSEPPQVYGSRQIELAWTAVPFLIVLVLFLVTARYIWGIERYQQPPGAVEVTIVGNQWWWEIRYPKLGVVTANELHVPVSDPARPTPTFITLESADVIHSFWVPELGPKMDMLPGVTNRLRLLARRAGSFDGQCAEFCGVEHAWMRIRIVAESRSEFDAWLRAQALPRSMIEADAERVFLSNICVTCHTIRGTAAAGTAGPDLTHVGARETIGAGVLPNDVARMRAWLADPQRYKPGALMPSVPLSSADLDALAAYLVSLK